MSDNCKVIVLLGVGQDSRNFFRELKFFMGHRTIRLIDIDVAKLGSGWSEDPTSPAMTSYIDSMVYRAGYSPTMIESYGHESVTDVVVDAGYLSDQNEPGVYTMLCTIFPNAKILKDVGVHRTDLKPPIWHVPIEELEIGVPAYNKLKRVGIETVGDLISKSAEELEAKNLKLSPKMLLGIREALAKHKLALKGEQPYMPNDKV